MDIAIYSALIVKVATDRCFMLLYDIAPLVKVKIYPRVNFRSDISIA